MMIKKVFALLAFVAMGVVSTAFGAEATASYNGRDLPIDTAITLAKKNADGGTITVFADCATEKGASGLKFSINESVTLTLTGGAYAGNDFGGEGTLAISGGTFDFDPSAYLVTGFSATKDPTSDVWTVGESHQHEWTFAADGAVLTATCANTSGDCSIEGAKIALTISAEGGEYSGSPFKATFSDNQSAFVKATGLEIGEIVYTKGGVVGSPVDAGEWTASATVGEKTISCVFTIAPLALTELTLSTPTTFAYDGADKQVSIASVKAGEFDATYSEDAASVRKAKGSPAEDKTYTVKVNGTGNFTGSATATWTITAPTGEFGKVTTTSAGWTVEGTTNRVTDSAKLVCKDGKWTMSMTVEVPHKTGDVTCIHPESLLKFSSTESVVKQGGLTAIAEGGHRGEKDVQSFTWTESFTLEEIKAADGVLRKTLTVYETPYSEQVTVLFVPVTLHNGGGIRETEFAMEVPLQGLVLLDEEGFQVYPEPEHTHVWNCSADGATLTATCEEEGCSIGTANVTLKIEDFAYGAAPQATVENGLLGLARGLKVGEITYTRPEYGAGKWYTGDYTAVVTVTVNEVEYKLAKEFKIVKPDGGYENGYEVGSSEIRFDTIGEALANIGAGDVVYAREDFNGETLDLSSDTDVTIDFGGKTLTYQEAQKAVNGFVIKNTGAGTVTLVNGVIDQPYGHTWVVVWVKGAKQVTVNGKFVFGEKIYAKNEADNDNNNLTITADNLKIVDGAYQAKFAGTLEIVGGDFTEDPTEFLGDGYALGTQKLDGYPFHVFSHVHELQYVLGEDGASILVICNEATGHDECVFNSKDVKLVLKAEDAKKELENAPYKGASLSYDDEFPVRDCQITYWQGGVQLEETPFEVGEYVAKVEVGGIIAQKAFKILSRERNFDIGAIKLEAGETTGYDFTDGTLKMLDGTGWKYYAAAYAPDGSKTEGWYATFTVDWPNETLNYTRLESAKFTMNGEKRVLTGEDDIPGVEIKKSITGAITGFVWYARVTPEELDAAAKAGQAVFTRELTAWGETWTSVLAKDNDGVAAMTLKVTTSLEGLKLYDGEGYLRYPLHDHEWSFEIDGGDMKATCAVDGCRYHDLPLTLTLTAGEDNGRLCNGKELTAKATCDADFETITGATIGEIVYRNADGEALDSAPIQPGEYTANVTVATEDGDYTVTVALVIRAGEIVVDGVHYEGADTATYFSKNATIAISLGRDFTASGTYVIKGEKTLDLNGFKIVSAEDTTIFRNEGTFAIDDLSRSGEGALEMNPAEYANGYLVDNAGTLAIENGTFVGAFSNGEEKTIELLGGVYSVEPEKGWVPDGYDIIPRTIDGAAWWTVESHEHRYQFVGFGSVMTATCSHLLVEERLFKDRNIQWTHCDAREMLMVLGGGKLGGVEYTGEPVQPTVYYVNVEELFKTIDNYGLKNLAKDLGITDVFEALVGMIKSGISNLFNAQAEGGIRNAILGSIRDSASEQTILNLVKSIGEGVSSSEDRFSSFKSAFITQEEYEEITGAKVVGFTYFDAKGNELAEAPSDVGFWTMKATIITQKGNTVSLWKTYWIKAASIKEAAIECEPAINAPLTYTGKQIDLDVKSVRIGSIALAGYNTVDELFAAITSGKLTAIDLYNILKDIGKFRDTMPTFADWLKEFGKILTGERTLEEFRADIEAMIKGRVLEPGVDYEIEGTLSATDVGEYSFTVKGIGNYTGSIKKNWSIVESSHQFPAGSFEQLRIVTDPDTGDRTFGVKVNYYSLLALTTYVMPENARLQFSLAPDEIYNGLNLGGSGLDVTAETDKVLLGDNDYLKSVTWRIKLSQAKIDEAFDAGFDELVYILTAGAVAGEGNENGYADTEYEMHVNLRDYISHKHNWSVTQTDAATLTATCVNSEGCGHPEPIKLAIGENGSTMVAFDGEPHFAGLDDAKLFTHFTGAVVEVAFADENGNAVDSVVEYGVYACTASVKVNGADYTLVGKVEIVPNREFGANALSEKVLKASCGTVDGNTMRVTNPSGLKYSNGKWYCAINIAWPNSTAQIFHTPQYTAPADLRLEGDVAKGETTVNTAKFLRITKLFLPEEYVKSVDWKIGFSLDDVKAAEGAGELVYTLVAGANRGENDGEGITPTEFKVVVPIDENLVLCDDEGNQLYPTLQAQGEQLFAMVTAAMPTREVAYTGEEVEAPEVVVSYKGQKLRRGVDFVLERDFKGVKIGAYVLAIRGIGVFAGVKIELEWEIKAEVRHNWNVRPLSARDEACGIMSREGDAFIVTKPENLELRDGKWHAGLAINLPFTVNLSSLKDSSFTDPEHAIVQVGEEGTPFSVADWEAGQIALDDCELGCDIGVNCFLLPRRLQLRYVREIDWTVAFTREEAEAARAAGEKFVVRKLVLSSPAWSHNADGIEPTTFKIVAKVSDILALRKLPIECSEVGLPNGDCRREFVWRAEPIRFFDGTVCFHGVPLREGVDFEVEGVREATAVGEYPLVIRGLRNFEGEIVLDWRIVEPRRPFAPFAMQPIDFNPTPMRGPRGPKYDFDPRNDRRCPVDRKWTPYNPYANYGYFTDLCATFVVTNGSHLAYNCCADRWYAGMTVDWPNFISPCDTMLTRLTGPWQAMFTLSTRPGVTNCVADIMLDDIFWCSNRLQGETMAAETALYRYPLTPLPIEYVKSQAWAPAITIDDLRAAKARGDEYVDYTMTAVSPAWLCDPDGVKATKWTIRIPLDIELWDCTTKRWPEHDHDWAYWVDDLKYMAFAECFSADGECSIADQPLTVSFTAPSQRKIYDGEPFTQELYGVDRYTKTTGATVEEIVYIDLSDNSEMTGAPVEIGSYKAKTRILARGGEKIMNIETVLTIEAKPRRQFGEFAMQPLVGRDGEPIGTVTKNVLTVGNASNLVYDAASETWYAGFTVRWPYDIEQILRTPFFTDREHADVSLSTDSGVLDYGVDRFWRIRDGEWQNFVTNITWTVPITTNLIAKTLADGGKNLVYRLTAGAEPWENDDTGIESTLFTMVIPLDGLELYNENDEPVWPENWYYITYAAPDGVDASEGGMAEEDKRVAGLRKALRPNAFTKEGYYFRGWSKRGGKVADFADRQVVCDPVAINKTLALTAVWTTNRVVAGDISSDEIASISKVVIVPVGKKASEGTPAQIYGDAPDWRYVAEFPKDGDYNIVTTFVDKDGHEITVTKLIKVNDLTPTESSIEIPEGNWSSICDGESAGDFVTLVGGLDELVEHVITDEELKNDSEVAVKLVVEQLPAEDTTYGYPEIVKETRATGIKPVDLRLEKWVDGEYDSELRDLTTPPETADPATYNDSLTLIIPFKREGRLDFGVVRYYEKEEGNPVTGSVDRLKENPEDGEEGFVIDEEAGTITLTISKFTTYAFVWEGAELTLDDFNWEMYLGTATWFGDLKVSCTRGWASSITNISLVYERSYFPSGKVQAQLCSSFNKKLIDNIITHEGVSCDKLTLSNPFTEDGLQSVEWEIARKLYNGYEGIDPENTEIEMAVAGYPTSPSDFCGWLVYVSYDCQYVLAVGKNSEALNEIILANNRQAADPIASECVNTTLAVGVPTTSDSTLYCRISDFTFDGGVIDAQAEVGADGYRGKAGDNLEVWLIGAKDVTSKYEDICQVTLDEEGRFRVENVPEEYHCFKIRMTVEK